MLTPTDLAATRHRIKDHRGHHPWRAMGLLSEWSVEWTRDLPPGRWGLTLHDEKRVLIRDGLDQAERRCTIAHETGHILRGPVSACHRLREESLVDRQVSRLLLPSVRKISRALAWHQADHDLAAAELWVDDRIFAARLSTLAPRERAHLDEQLATILV